MDCAPRPGEEASPFLVIREFLEHEGWRGIARSTTSVLNISEATVLRD